MSRRPQFIGSSLQAVLAAIVFSCTFGHLSSGAAMGKVPPVAIKDQLAEYRRVLLAYFKAFNLLPILLPAGQKPGDVFDMRQMGILRSTAEECFPSLHQPSAVPSVLAYTFELDTSKAGLALGVPNLGSIDVSSDFESTVTVSYTDVKVAVVSQQALKSGVADSCPDVAAITNQLDQTLSDTSKPALLAIVGTLVTARREIFIGTKQGFDIKTSVDKLGTVLSAAGIGAALKVVGLDPSLSVALGFGGKKGVLVQSDLELPVAFMPAFIPEVLFASVQGGPSDQPKEQVMQWHRFDATSPTSTQLLGLIIDDAIKH